MSDGKDRARVEAVLNRGRFDIDAIKNIVDAIYNGDTPGPGPGPGPEPTPEEDEMVKIATKTLDKSECLRIYEEIISASDVIEYSEETLKVAYDVLKNIHIADLPFITIIGNIHLAVHYEPEGNTFSGESDTSVVYANAVSDINDALYNYEGTDFTMTHSTISLQSSNSLTNGGMFDYELTKVADGNAEPMSAWPTGLFSCALNILGRWEMEELTDENCKEFTVTLDVYRSAPLTDVGPTVEDVMPWPESDDNGDVENVS